MRLGKGKAGFTLIEILVVIAIIGILVSLTVPAIQKVRENAARAECQNQLKNIALACHGYQQAYGCFPPTRDKVLSDAPGWIARILPYIEQEALALMNSDDRANGVSIAAWRTRGEKIPLLLCAQDARFLTPNFSKGATRGFTSYLGVTGSDWSNGVLPRRTFGVRLFDITDGTSNTLMIGERPPNFDFVWGEHLFADWDSILSTYNSTLCTSVGPTGTAYDQSNTTPNYPCSSKAPYIFSPPMDPTLLDNCEMYHYFSLHPSGANWAFADCTVRYFNYAAGPTTIVSLSTRDGAEIVDSGGF